MPGSFLPIELEALRFDQEQELDAQCTIWRILSEGTVSKADATYSAPSTSTIYTGPCFIAPIVSRRDRFDTHGEQQVYQNQYRVLLPWDSNVIKIGDMYQTTEAEDDLLLTKVMEVKDVLLISDISMRRLTLIDITE